MTLDLETKLLGPVVVGGLGGSGTGLVAEILQEVGVYMGADLNHASDNLWFGFLVPRARWELSPPEQTDQPVYQALRLFDLAMTGRLELTRADKKFIKEAVSRGKRLAPTDRSPDWFRQRMHNLEHSRENFPLGTRLWGWKLPGTYFYLPYLHQYYEARLQYVHVIRHGVYMSRSRNQNQFKHWGDLLGIDPESAGSDASASLDFWIAANRLAISHAHALSADRFYLLNYDELCSNPDRGVSQLLDFLRADPPQSIVDKVVTMPQPRESRFSAEELRSFTSIQLETVRDLGFDITEL